MDKVCFRMLWKLGLSLTLAACGESTQFREVTTGTRVSVEQNPEMSPLPDNSGTDKSSSSPYAGDEQPTPPLDSARSADSSRKNESPMPSEPARSAGSTPPAQQLFTDCEEHPERGIVAHLYELPVDTSRLPDFKTLTSLRTVCLSQLNITNRQFSEGFPGVENLFEWFALDMKFKVTLPNSGSYDFKLVSDDGAILWIDGVKVIDNDGLHPVAAKNATVKLNAGTHIFRVAYYQGPRWHIALELFWKIPGAQSSVHIPASAISRLQ